MNDPYKVLGVSRDATDAEIQKAYLELAKKYHPDNYADNPLRDLVEEKMKEINEARDTIQKERSGKKNGTNGTSDGGFRRDASSPYAEIREMIANREYSRADVKLENVVASERDAEWHFLKGVLLAYRGRTYDALRHLEEACRRSPNNEEYRSAYETLRTQSRVGVRNNNDAALCDCCSTMLLLDCLCGGCGPGRC